MHSSPAGLTTYIDRDALEKSAGCFLMAAMRSMDPGALEVTQPQAEYAVTLIAAAFGKSRAEVVAQLASYYHAHRTELQAEPEHHIRGVALREVISPAVKRRRN